MVIHDFHNNKIIFKDGLLKNIPNLLAKYRISGYDNTIIIGENAKVQSGQFAISGSRNYITIGANSDIRGFLIRADGMQNCVSIGEDVYFGGGVIHVMEHTKIQIGNRCLCSHDIDIRSGDGHALYFDDSDKKANAGKNIIIGNHVWIGIRTQILKGVTIADDCMIGASSMVNKSFMEKNCMIAGHPAKIIRKNICWQR